jgi:chorismate synthase
MNSIGTIFRTSIFGESHGPLIGIVIDGVQPGIELCADDFSEDIQRRKAGAKGTTPRIEEDLPILVSGVFNGKTTGAPLCIQFENKNTRSEDYQKTREFFRPGHADFVAHQKYNGFEDFRGGGHFSGRLTLPIVAAGVVAKKMLSSIKIKATLVEIAGEKDLEKGLQKGIDAKDSVGGIVECVCENMPIGLGEPFFDSLESSISHAIFAIPAIKGIEFGSGFASTRQFGSENNDLYIDATGKTQTNHTGGISGGISNGNDLIFRVAVKPTSSIGKTQVTWNQSSEKMDELQVKGRHDLCIALRVPVVVEAMTAIVLNDFILRKI